MIAIRTRTITRCRCEVLDPRIAAWASAAGDDFDVTEAADGIVGVSGVATGCVSILKSLRQRLPDFSRAANQRSNRGTRGSEPSVRRLYGLSPSSSRISMKRNSPFAVWSGTADRVSKSSSTGRRTSRR